VIAGLKILKRKGKKLAVLTAFERPEADFFLEQMGLREYFDVVLSTEEVREHRPHPQGLLVALSHLNALPEECLYVGDTMLDIQFARNAGVKVACVKTGAQDNGLLEKEKPDYLVENFREMVSVLSPSL
jgi:pyrophosphatase PpaX